MLFSPRSIMVVTGCLGFASALAPAQPIDLDGIDQVEGFNARVVQLQIELGGIKVGPAPAAPPTPDPKPDAPKTGTTAPGTATPAEQPKPAVPVDPHVVRFLMADGTLISGKLSITDLAIDTKFGRLNVPITKIRYVKPGLGSRPKLRAQVDEWIKNLGAEDAAQRKQAAAELLKVGPVLREELRNKMGDTTTAQAAEIRTLIDKMSEGADADLSDPTEFTTLDIVATTDFTMTGKIVPQTLELGSEFGTFTLPVEMLVKADRDTGEPEELRKTFAVDEQNFINRTMKSTGLRVAKGDKIVLKAGGQLTMTRWGNVMSTPEGASNTGWYQNGKIYNGALVYRIGNGTIQKAGSSLTVTAGEAGTLYVGIAINPRFGAEGYQFPGSYNVDVRVQKK